MKKTLIVGAVLLLAAGLAAASTRREAVAGGSPDELPPLGPLDWPTFSTAWEQVLPETDPIEAAEGLPMDQDRNVSAFLSMIATAEGTDRRPNAYAVCFGYRFTITDFRDHPATLGVWKGERLSDAQCRGAGFGPGCVSTAAGRYQMIRPTWEALKRRLRLSDFGPASQDAAAVQLLKDCGAYDSVRTGQFTAAVSAARKTWASLPGAGYAQPERSFAALIEAFTDAGGVVA